jgi:general stress protein 26
MYGLAKFSCQYLYRLIHPDEHVKGVVYGRYRSGRGLLGYTEGMLVATDRRVIFLDYKPGLTAVEEVAYYAVSGVDYVTAGPFSAVTLHTKVGDFGLRYANSTCIRKFVTYLEGRQIEQHEPATSAIAVPQQAEPPRSTTGSETLTFLHQHNTAVLSTVSQKGEAHGAAVHYLLEASGNIYILTKSATRKAQNLLATKEAAVTVYDADRLQTVQAHGRAAVEERAEIQAWAFRTLCQQYSRVQGAYISPATLLDTGRVIIFRIEPDNVRFIDFTLKQDAAARA